MNLQSLIDRLSGVLKLLLKSTGPKKSPEDVDSAIKMLRGVIAELEKMVD